MGKVSTVCFWVIGDQIKIYWITTGHMPGTENLLFGSLHDHH